MIYVNQWYINVYNLFFLGCYTIVSLMLCYDLIFMHDHLNIHAKNLSYFLDE